MEEPTPVTNEELILDLVRTTSADISDIKEDVATLTERSIGQDKRIGRIEKATGAAWVTILGSLLAAVFLSGCSLFAGLAAPPAAAPPSAPVVDAVQRAVDNTVALHTGDKEQRFCSGAVVEAAILTAAHCVTDGKSFKVWYQGAMYEGRVITADEKTDLAVIAAVGARLKKTVPLATKMPQLGNKVIWMGYPLADDFIMGVGIVGNPSVPVGASTMMAIYGQFIPGNSGGPVFNHRGELIGIVSASMAYGSPTGVPHFLPVGYAVRLDTIQTALAR
jgi:S1-C subfamily serine protease